MNNIFTLICRSELAKNILEQNGFVHNNNQPFCFDINTYKMDYLNFFKFLSKLQLYVIITPAFSLLNNIYIDTIDNVNKGY